MSRFNLFFLGVTIGFLIAVVIHSYGSLLSIQEVLK